MTQIRALMEILTKYLGSYARVLFADWERIVGVAKEIGADLAFFVGFVLSRLGDTIPYVYQLISNFEEGKQYGLPSC